MDTSGVILRKDDHTYWRGDIRVPGVTECLTKLRVIDGMEFVDEDALERGTATHDFLSTVMRCWSTDDDPAPPPALYRGYCDAGLSAIIDYNLTPVAVEYIMFSTVMAIAGMLDLVACCKRPGYPTSAGVVDWKTGREYDWHIYQLVIYAMIYHEVTGLTPSWAANFYLQADGSYKPKFRAITPDLQHQALAFISTAKWLIAHR